MGVARVLLYPGYQIYRGIKHQVVLNAQAKERGYILDIASRLAKSFGLPKKAANEIGQKLMAEVALRRLPMRDAAFVGDPFEICAAIESSLSGIAKHPPINMPMLESLRIAIPQKEKLVDKLLRRFYDPFIPVKSAQVLDDLISGEMTEASALAKAEGEKNQLQSLLDKAREEIRYLGLGHQAYVEIMSAIYHSQPGQNLNESIEEMFKVITHWAYRVIGRSDEKTEGKKGSEAAGWIVTGPDGKIGVPYRFVIAQADGKITNSPIYSLKRNQINGEHCLLMTDAKSVVNVNQENRGRFITMAEMEELQLVERLVMVEGKDGFRRLFERIPRPGSELIEHLIAGKTFRIIGKIAGFAVGFQEAVRGEKNAFMELKELNVATLTLEPGQIIPYVVEGTTINLMSAGSANENLRREKMEKGEGVEEDCRRGGLEVGVVHQKLERAIGNVRTSALKPLSYMISDARIFGERPQNRFLLDIVGVKSYFLRSLFEFNEQGEAVCLGCLEVTNPEIIPEQLSQEEENRLLHQFKMGQVFAELASTGIMIKLLQQEVDSLMKRYLGEKVYRLVRARDYQTLAGRRIDGPTIMFADVSGFTALSDVLQDQPGEVVKMLTELFKQLDPVVTENGGMVDKHDGDCIIGDFGVPQRFPHDAEAALTAAIGLQRELQVINRLPQMRALYKAYNLKDLGMTIGLNTGPVIGGNIGHAASKEEYTVIGDTVNIAARLQHAGVKGQILIHEKTYDALSEEYRNEMVRVFNAHNRNIGELREYLQQQIMEDGSRIPVEQLETVLMIYFSLYKDANLHQLFIPSVFHAKNKKEPVKCYYVRWDRHAWRYPFLKQALDMVGIKLKTEPHFENQPQTLEQTYAQLNRVEDEAELGEMFDAFMQLLAKHRLKVKSEKD